MKIVTPLVVALLVASPALAENEAPVAPDQASIAQTCQEHFTVARETTHRFEWLPSYTKSAHVPSTGQSAVMVGASVLSKKGDETIEYLYCLFGADRTTPAQSQDGVGMFDEDWSVYKQTNAAGAFEK